MKTVLKDDETEKEINEESEDLNFPVIKIKQFAKMRKDEFKRLPIYCGNAANPEAKEIYNLTHLLDLRIKVVAYKPRNAPKRCFKYQGSGHSQLSCSNPPSCMKCAENHLSYDCPRPREEKATCVLCLGDYIANFRGSPRYQRTLLNQKENKNLFRLVGERVSGTPKRN